MTPDITYVVGAGPYSYRADGRRMNQSEATSYLIEAHGMSFSAANRLLDMITTQAVRDAGAPDVERVTHEFSDQYRIAGADPQGRRDATRHLVHEWRLTPAEAAGVLDHAPAVAS